MMHSRAQPSAERGTQEEDTIYQENQAYHEYGALHESLWDQEQQQHQQHSRVNGSIGYSSASPTGQTPTSQPRSSPIAIVRLPGDVPSHPTNRDSDDDDEDDEDSEIDVVQRDAIRLRKKYGDKVLAASYQPGMVMADQEQPTTVATSLSSKRMLKAPYLGSLSKSDSFLTALPPISLSTEEEAMYNYEEPPGEITNYGSLRESHQRGKFLDGPSSYREPRSGQIRRLDHRVRFPTTGTRASLSSSQQEQHALSIGERIRQAQKDKESLKQTVKETTTDSDAAAGGGGGGGTSTLSMMMDEASKNPESAAVAEEGVVNELVRGFGQGSELMTALGADDDHAYDTFDPPTMMSTSMTAFEILHGLSRSLTDSRSAQRQESSVHGGNNRVLLPNESQIRDQQFQPLSRTLSDPTPRGPLLPPTLQLQQQQLHAPLGNDNLLVGAPSTNPYWPNPYSALDPSVVPHDALNNPMITSSDPIHNPDTDAAFDMDME